MAYNTKSIVKDVNQKPVPQIYNPKTDNYEVLQGENGASKVIPYGTDGQPIKFSSFPDRSGQTKQNQILQSMVDNMTSYSRVLEEVAVARQGKTDLSENLSEMKSEIDKKTNQADFEEDKLEKEGLIGDLSILETIEKDNLVGAINEVEKDLVAHKEKYTTQRQQDNLKVATVEKELNDYKGTMAGVNVNQEAKQKVSGYGTISLPKNTANGQVSVSVKGLTATNLVKNSNFKDGINDWSNVNGSIISASSNIGKAIIPSSLTYAILAHRRISTWKENRKYYFKVDLRGKSSQPEAYLLARVGHMPSTTTADIGRTTDVIENKWYNLSNVVATTSVTLEEEMLFWLQISGGIPGDFVEIRNPLVIDLTDMFGLGKEPTKEECDKIFTNYFDGTKSTISASRLKSVGKNLVFNGSGEHGTNGWDGFVLNSDGYLQSSGLSYNEPKLGEFIPTEGGESLYYRSLAYRISGFNVRFQVWGYDVNKKNISYRLITLLPNSDDSSSPSLLQGSIPVPPGVKYIRVGLSFNAGNIGAMKDVMISRTPITSYESYKSSTSYIKAKNGSNIVELRSLSNGVCDEIVGEKLINRIGSDGLELTTSTEIPLQTSGNLMGYPSGTVYVENVVADAGNYTTKFDIKDIQLPIKSIDKLIKYNFETGVQTVLDTSLAVINADKKSFTHPNLTNKDMVFVDYFYDVESTLGETTIEYLDSRHTIKDTTNDKFYSWDIKSTNGVPTVELTEVL